DHYHCDVAAVCQHSVERTQIVAKIESARYGRAVRGVTVDNGVQNFAAFEIGARRLKPWPDGVRCIVLCVEKDNRAGLAHRAIYRPLTAGCNHSCKSRGELRLPKPGMTGDHRNLAARNSSGPQPAYWLCLNVAQASRDVGRTVCTGLGAFHCAWSTREHRQREQIA